MKRTKDVSAAAWFYGQPGFHTPPAVVCSYCKQLLSDGTLPASHGLGACCWNRARAEVGLPPKPFPVAK